MSSFKHFIYIWTILSKVYLSASICHQITWKQFRHSTDGCIKLYPTVNLVTVAYKIEKDDLSNKVFFPKKKTFFFFWKIPPKMLKVNFRSIKFLKIIKCTPRTLAAGIVEAFTVWKNEKFTLPKIISWKRLLHSAN